MHVLVHVACVAARARYSTDLLTYRTPTSYYTRGALVAQLAGRDQLDGDACPLPLAARAELHLEIALQQAHL